MEWQRTHSIVLMTSVAILLVTLQSGCNKTGSSQSTGQTSRSKSIVLPADWPLNISLPTDATATDLPLELQDKTSSDKAQSHLVESYSDSLGGISTETWSIGFSSGLDFANSQNDLESQLKQLKHRRMQEDRVDEQIYISPDNTIMIGLLNTGQNGQTYSYALSISKANKPISPWAYSTAEEIK